MANLTNFEFLNSQSSKVMLSKNNYYNFCSTPLVLTRDMVENGIWVKGEVSIYAAVCIYAGEIYNYDNQIIIGSVYDDGGDNTYKNLFDLLQFSDFLKSGAIDSELLDSGYYALASESVIDDSCWINGEMYYHKTSQGNLTKVEVSLDGGKTYGLLWTNAVNLTLSQFSNFTDSFGEVSGVGVLFQINFDGDNTRNITYTITEPEYTGRIIRYDAIPKYNNSQNLVLVGITFTGKEDLPIIVTATIEGTDTYMEETASIPVTVPGGWGAESTTSRYELVPIDSNGKPCFNFNFEIPDTNGDYGFTINYNIVNYYTINGVSGSEIIQSGSQYIGPYSSPGTYYVNINDSYSDTLYSTEIAVNIAIAQPPIIANGWYIRDPYVGDISTNVAGQCYDVTVSFEVYDPVVDSYFTSTNNFEVPFGYEQSGYDVNLSYSELYYDSTVGYDKTHTISYPDAYTIFIN